ncbi:hypothetical protein DV711_07010 [Motiliproteus coralliicola]|uniref:Fibronectin type-III domain-containing protein n=1 Tax=Motiliproteus coralliicola TaxID=2283196 RepID=A0A369WKW6_9GAMM|nr:Ig-like domain-containing protein [Motiliproteus coralliicola]RDE22352.1 hypothetical protein DV711_07010 [Motiliproteus coralliicola]
MFAEFNVSLDPTRLYPESIVLSGALSGQVPISVELVDDWRLKISFLMLDEDVYDLTIGPHIYSTNGKGMNQNGVLPELEADDAFQGQFVVDVTDPAPPSLNFPVSPAETDLNQRSVTLTGTREANTAIEINGTVEVPLGSEDWSVTLSLEEGLNSLSIFAIDAVGNRSLEQSLLLAVDSEQPEINAASPIGLSNQVPTQFAFTVQDDEHGVGSSGIDLYNSSVTVSRDGIELSGSLSLVGDQLIFTPATILLQGSYTLVVSVADKAGNRSLLRTYHFTLDYTKPSTPLLDVYPPITANNVHTFSGTKEADSGLWLDDKLVVPISGETSWSHEVTLVEGDNHFTLQARDAAGNVNESDVAVAIRYDNTAPGPVTLNVDPNGDGTTLVLDWQTYDELANGNDIAEYRVYAQSTTFADVSALNPVMVVPGGQQQVTLQGLNRNMAQHLAVVAVDSQGLLQSEVSPVVKTPLDQVAPDVVQQLRVQAAATALTLDWQAPVSQVDDLAGYRIAVDDGNQATQIEMLVDSLVDPLDPVTQVLDSLSAASGYTLSVSAFDHDDNVSAPVTVAAATLLANPTNLDMVGHSNQLALQWDAVTPWPLLKAYAVYVETESFNSIEGLSPRLVVDKGASSTMTLSQAVAGLENDTTYHVAVTAVNISDGESVVIASQAATPTADTEGPQVETLSYQDATRTLDLSSAPILTLSGQVQVAASDRSAISRVAFYLDGVLLGTDFAAEHGVYSQALDLVTLSDGAHSLKVELFDTWDNRSEQTTVITVAIAAPSAPILSAPGNNLLTNQPSLRIEGTATPGTQVQLYRNNLTLDDPLVVNSQGEFSLTTTLQEGENRYHARAEYAGRGGFGDSSDEVLVTLNTKIPDAPGALQASSGKLGQVFLSWPPVTSTDPDNQTQGYQLYRSTQAFSTTDEAGVEPVNSGLLDSTEFVDLPIPDGTYYYRVVALNQLDTPSVPSTQAIGRADSAGPRAEISYTPLGHYDPVTERYGVGGVEVSVTFNEPLRNDPYLAVVPAGGVPITVDLTKDYSDDRRYTGSFNIDAQTLSGTAYAVLSAFDDANNRGTEVDQGESLLIDTQGPAVTELDLNPVTPLKVDAANGLWVEVLVTLADEVKEGHSPTLIPLIDDQVLATYSAGISLSRDGQSSPGTPLWVGGFQLPSTAGQDAQGSPIAARLSFQFAAEDDLGNQTDRINAPNQFQLYQGELPALPSPQGLSAIAQPGGSVALSWKAVDQAAGYVLYRRAPGTTELSELQSLTDTAFTDTTGSDGDYAYAVASLRSENDQQTLSAPSPLVLVSADRIAPAAPTGTILAPNGAGILVTWDPPTLDADGQPQDLEGLTYNLYRLPLAEGESADAQTLAQSSPIQTGIPKPIALDSTPSEVEHSYVLTAVDAAGNESAPGETRYFNFGLLPVADLRISLDADGQPQLRWSHSGTAIEGYDVYYGEDDQLTKLNDSLIPHQGSPTYFTDTQYNGGQPSDGAAIQRRYTVVAVDPQGAESLGHSLVLPALSVHLEADDSGEPLLYRGVMNRLQFRVDNQGDQAANGLTLTVSVDDNGTLRQHHSERFSVEAGGVTLVPVVIGGYEQLDISSQLQLSISQQPQAGENVSIGQHKEVIVGDKALFATLNLETFTRGSTGQASFTLENSSDVETEIILARNDGNSASNEVRLILEDLDGNVLSTQPVRQFSGGVINVSNGAMVARLAPGERFTSALFEVPVPAASPDQVNLRLEIDQFHYQVGRSTHVAIEGTGNRRQLSLADLPYEATVDSITPAQLYGDGEVTISGQVIDSVTDAPVAGAPVTLVTQVRGFEQQANLFADGEGAYRYTFDPQGNAGDYTVSAIHPDSITRPGQGSFQVQNAGVSPANIEIQVPRNYTQSVSVRVNTGYASALNNIRLKQLVAPGDDALSPSLPTGISLDPGTPLNLAAKRSGYLKLQFSGNNNAADTGTLYFAVVADDSTDGAASGSELELGRVALSYRLAEAVPALRASPSYIDSGVGLGKAVTETVTLTNTGLETLKNPILTLLDDQGNPAPSWAYISGNATPGDLAVGESLPVQLTFNPPAETSEGDLEFRLMVDGDNLDPFPVQAFLAVVSAERGKMSFHISDIYTATPGDDGLLIPGLAGAKIELQHEKVLSEKHTRYSDSYGDVLFPDLAAGDYRYRISAFDHDSVSGRIRVKSGVTGFEEVFLMNALISVEWEVKEITIEDKYEIIVQAEFETNVPVALVVADPLSVNLPVMKAGEVFYGELTLTNHGLIPAQSMSANLPTGNQYVSMEYLAEVPETLGSGEVFVLPYRVQALNDFDPALDGDAGGGGCGSFQLNGQVKYSSVCSNGAVVNSSTGTTWSSSWQSSSCGGSGGSSGGGGSVSYSYGGGGGGSIVSRNYGTFENEDKGLFCAPLPVCTTGNCPWVSGGTSPGG